MMTRDAALDVVGLGAFIALLVIVLYELVK